MISLSIFQLWLCARNVVPVLSAKGDGFLSTQGFAAGHEGKRRKPTGLCHRIMREEEDSWHERANHSYSHY